MVLDTSLGNKVTWENHTNPHQAMNTNDPNNPKEIDNTNDPNSPKEIDRRSSMSMNLDKPIKSPDTYDSSPSMVDSGYTPFFPQPSSSSSTDLNELDKLNKDIQPSHSHSHTHSPQASRLKEGNPNPSRLNQHLQSKELFKLRQANALALAHLAWAFGRLKGVRTDSVFLHELGLCAAAR